MIRRWAVPVLAVLGLIVAGYLSYHKLLGVGLYCVGGGKACDRVNASIYAYLAGVPVAYLGFAGYLAQGAIGLFTLQSRPTSAAALLIGWALALIGFLFSLYLTYVELFVLYDICQWCVASATLQTLLLIVFTWQVRSGDPGPG